MTEDNLSLNDNNGTNTSSTNAVHSSALSKRAHGYIKSSPSWTAAVGKVFADPYDKEENPDGYINLGVAENVLLHDALRERIEKQRKNTEVNPRLFGYGTFSGSLALRTKLKWLFEERLMRGVELSVDNIAIGNGSGPILEQLAYLLSDVGDIFVIPAPYYMGFELDMQTRCGGEVVPWNMRLVKVSEASETEPEQWRYELDFDALDALYDKYGSRIRGLVWTNPHNPTGQIFSENDTKRILAWSIERSIAVISDELYGLSAYNARSGPQLVSTMAVAEKYASELGGLDRVHAAVHVVYSFSKDFGLNGYRVGVLCSKNSALLSAFASVSVFTLASNETQQTVAELISDHNDVDQFLDSSNEMLLATWNKAKSFLCEHGVPVVEPAAGMFLWCNLLQCNKNKSFTLDADGEKELWLHLLDTAKTYITPGFVFRSTDNAGWFRICATCAPEETMLEGLKRIFAALQDSK